MLSQLCLGGSHTLSGPRRLLAQLGTPWYRSAALTTGSKKVSVRKQPESGPRGQNPSPPAGVTGDRRGGLPARAAVSNPAITKKNHMPGAISDCYACPATRSAILRPGSGHGLLSAPHTCSALHCSCLYLLLCKRKCSSTHAGKQPMSVSHTSVLYLWFCSPGSQVRVIGAGRESPTASAVSPPSLNEPQESQ